MCHDNVGICGWQKNSFIDFPGTVSTVLFFAGCNLRCPWCHNPDIVRNNLPQISFNEILGYVDKRHNVIEGVVLTGGEPTLHKTLPYVVETIRNRTLKIKIDSNGLNPEMIVQCKPDYFALDIKTDLSLYPEIGCKLSGYADLLLRSIDIVKEMGNRAEIRITVVPEYINSQIINGIASMLDGVSLVYLQQFSNRHELLDLMFSNKTPVSIDEIRTFRDIIAERVGTCVIRGVEK